VLSAYAKDNAKLGIKCGLFEGMVMDTAGVAMLASMPSREALLGRLVGDLKSPVTKVAMVVKATVNQLAYVLQAMAAKKEAEA
jgi:large subunit ribosomal protein L10